MPKRAPDYMAARREEILGGAHRCFARWGYEGATIPRLEREIGLSHGAIFNHFRNKLDLFFELARRDHERWDRIWREEGFEALAREIVEEDPAWIRVHLEFERRLRTDKKLVARYRREFAAESAAEADDVRAFLHVVLDGLALARARSDAPIDAEPILKFVRRALAPGGKRAARSQR
jgi:AcrR family transcriptional regulator